MALATSAQSRHIVSQEAFWQMKREQPSLQAPNFPWHALPSSSPDLIVKVWGSLCIPLPRGQQGGGRRAICSCHLFTYGALFLPGDRIYHSPFMWPIGILDIYVCVKGGWRGDDSVVKGTSGDSDSVPSINMVPFSTSCNSTSWGSEVLFCCPRLPVRT